MTSDIRFRSLLLQRLFATRMRRIAATIFAGLLVTVVATAGVWAAFQSVGSTGPELTAMLPQGALLTIEAKDFAGLLKHWDDSTEKAAWLKSDNYSVFSRSRLFGRLGDAQNEFAQAAGLPPDMSFLSEVAGSESVFAWYDIGKLEFLYITRMPEGSANKTRLVQMRGKFSARQIGDKTFYVRTLPDQHQADSNQADRPQGQPRTVAFAASGDWLLLATREDLMAGALTLLAANAGSAAPTESLAAEPWFVDAHAAAAKGSGELRMTLDLEKIVPSPYFRSYWVQRNVSEMKQYRSAVADLYIGADTFREERVLVPKSSQESGTSAPDLAALTALLPQHEGVYRAVAAPGVEAALASLDEKLFQHPTSGFTDTLLAPDADVSVHEVGSASDLETRIDDAPLERPIKGAELVLLRQALAASDLEAMMTVNRTGDAADGIWVPFQAAVVLSSGKDWDASAMQFALQQAMQARLTASGLGLAWKPVKIKEGSYFEISNTRPLEMALRGKLCILTDNPGLMQEMLGSLWNATHGRARGRKSIDNLQTKPEANQSQATLIAGFDFAQERASFARWTALVDRTNSGSSGQVGDAGTEAGAGPGSGEPSFFSQNMRSLGDVFVPLESERVVESKDGAFTRQTVTYAWRH